MKIETMLSEIEIPDSLNEVSFSAIDDARTYIKRRRRIQTTVLSLAAVLITGVSGILIVQPAWAQEIPFIANVFEYVNDRLTMKGDYPSYVTNVNETVRDGDIGITLTEVYCDGENLFVSYNIHDFDEKSDQFAGSYLDNLVKLEGSLTLRTEDDQTVALEEMHNGEYVHGKFIDDKTYIGVATFLYENQKFPDKFTVDINLNRMTLLAENADDTDRMISGNWNFTIPVEVNYDDITEISPDIQKDDHSIDKIIISPFLVTVYTSYPDIYWDREYPDYAVVCFSDKSVLPLGCEAVAGHTSAVHKFSRSEMGDQLRIYIVDYQKIRDAGEDDTVEEVVEKYAITYTTLDLEEN